MYKGTLDKVSPIHETNTLVDRYFAEGVSVGHKETVKTVRHDHILLAIDGFIEALLWLKDRMSGVPADVKCTHSKKPTPLTELGTL